MVYRMRSCLPDDVCGILSAIRDMTPDDRL